MTRPFEGRVAVITGGARGIGRGIAQRFARDGAHCVITYRRGADVAAGVVRELEGEGVRALALPLELADPAQVPAVFERIGETFGRVDVLVANAAATSFRPLADQKEHNVRRTFTITVDSFIAAVQGAVPLMRGRPGRIVIVSGIDSFHAMPGHGLLGGAKAAAESLVRADHRQRSESRDDRHGFLAPLHRDRASSRPCAGHGRGCRGDPGAPNRDGGGRGGLCRLARLGSLGIPHRADHRTGRGAHDRVAAGQTGGRVGPPLSEVTRIAPRCRAWTAKPPA